MTKLSKIPMLVAGAMLAAFALLTSAADPAWAIVPAPASSLRALTAPSMVTKVVHNCSYGYGGYYGCRPYGYLLFYHHHHFYFGGFGHGGGHGHHG